MIELQNLSYSYTRLHKALDGVSLSIDNGLCLLLGENGAGKTTLLGVISGELLAEDGSATFDGEDIGKRLPSTMNRIFFLPDNFRVPFRNIAEMARCHAPFYPDFDSSMLMENLKAFGLDGKERLKDLSLGMRQKTFIAYALALRPSLLLLDEPANGLDIDSKKEFRRMVSRCTSEDQTVIISTHTVADLEVLYDSVAILHKGRTRVSLRTEEISRRLAFVTSATEVEGALYQERDSGVYRAIVETPAPYSTAVNFELLYSALMKDGDDRILQLLTNQ